MHMRTLVLSMLLLNLLIINSYAVIIDHQSIASVDSATQGVMDFVGQQRWFFTHASVGGNMIEGMNDLHASNANKYRLTSSWVGFDATGTRAANPPSTTNYGKIYEFGRGNPGWASKYTIFDQSVRLSGWRYNSIDFAMDKLCYIDQDAGDSTHNPTGYETYLNKMSSLEAAYPSTKIVYTTMPLTTSTGSDNVLRNKYNQEVRSYCINNNKLLFDIADMEAYDPSGNRQTFSFGGQTYDKLFSGYSNDGGHLNASGQEQIAKGWYAACIYGTRFVSFNENWVGTATGHVGEWGTAGNWSPDAGLAIVPDAAGIKLTFGKAGSNSTANIGSNNRVIGGINMLGDVYTTIMGNAVLTLDNNGSGSQINVAGEHTIAAGLFFNDDLTIGGGGTVDINGSLSGEATKEFTVGSDTTVKLNGPAQGIHNSITVYGTLVSRSIRVHRLTIGNTTNAMVAVPEPGSVVLLLVCSAVGICAYCFKRYAISRKNRYIDY